MVTVLLRVSMEASGIGYVGFQVAVHNPMARHSFKTPHKDTQHPSPMLEFSTHFQLFWRPGYTKGDIVALWRVLPVDMQTLAKQAADNQLDSQNEDDDKHRGDSLKTFQIFP